MDCNTVQTSVGREEREKQSGGFGASGEGIELGRDFGHKLRYHIRNGSAAARSLERR